MYFDTTTTSRIYVRQTPHFTAIDDYMNLMEETVLFSCATSYILRS